MPHLFAICDMVGGFPNIPASTPVKGWAHFDSLGQYGAYLFSGTAAQLAALNALPNMAGLVEMTGKADNEREWLELDTVIAAGVRTKINNWLTARGRPTIPAGQTYKQVVRAIFQYFNSRFDPLEAVFVTDK